ncbi:MAG TPA: DUF3300 domain-containing protein [Gemmatimonadales bacterium]|nr:DUF3300 domain-containing protein [Gemmatimonadales bacterium]
MRFERIAVWALSCALVGGADSLNAQDQPAPTQAATQTPDQLRQLVAPIALYPDALVAQILAAATYPVQVVEAQRWVQQRTDLAADQVAAAADSESWDPSVKALTGFPSVLAMMDKNLGWTSALGEAYTNQSQDVLDAVQALRKQAQDNGRLTNTPQQTVTTEGQIISIAPANPDIVYVPVYDPCTIYGWPVVVYPRWQCVVGPPAIWFGVGVPIGWWPRAWGWGWHSWGFDWHRRVVIYNRAPWVSRTNTFYGRVGRPGSPRPVPGRPAPGARGVRPSIEPNRTGPLDRGFGQDRAHTGTHSGVFSGFGQGGSARGASARGRASAGSGGARGGGGGGHRK